MNIDYEKLRNDLIDYFGSAMVVVSPVAIFDIDRVERANESELIQIAIENGFDICQYEEQKYYRK